MAPKPFCSYAKWVAEKDEKTKAEFDAFLKNTTASTASIHRFLQQEYDAPFGLTAFKFHRNKWCVCP